ncbi:hypothetical protein LINPERHAP1_LOCUS18415 [Linum perenne]
MGQAICREIRNFFVSTTVLTNWNDAFIMLIPKVAHPEENTQLRPISVTNFRMKSNDLGKHD